MKSHIIQASGIQFHVPSVYWIVSAVNNSLYASDQKKPDMQIKGKYGLSLVHHTSDSVQKLRIS